MNMMTAPLEVRPSLRQAHVNFADPDLPLMLPGRPEMRYDLPKAWRNFRELVKDKGFLTLIGRINSRIDFQPHEEFAKTLEAERAALKALYVSLGKLPG